MLDHQTLPGSPNLESSAVQEIPARSQKENAIFHPPAAGRNRRQHPGCSDRTMNHSPNEVTPPFASGNETKFRQHHPQKLVFVSTKSYKKVVMDTNRKNLQLLFFSPLFTQPFFSQDSIGFIPVTATLQDLGGVRFHWMITTEGAVDPPNL